MSLTENTLAQIVSVKPAAAYVFEKHDLDYCCHGKQTLKQACEDDYIKLKTVEHELEAVLFYDDGASSTNFSVMPVHELIQHIVDRHHRYVKEATPRIIAHLQKVISKHAGHHPEVNEISKLFAAVSNEMGQHMYKEENILFPRIKEIAFAADNRFNYWEHEKSYLTSPIHLMESEHEIAGTILHKIRSLTHHFTPPADACATFKLAYSELNEYERDLHRHVHLENNILFPKAMALFSMGGKSNLN